MTLKRSTLAIVAAIGALSASGCNRKSNEFVPPPPPEVKVQRPLVQTTTVFLEFPGRSSASERVEIRARVSGFLESRDFQPGQVVKKDQLLFTIEPEQFSAKVAAAEGNLAQANALLAIAKTNYDKRKAAFDKNQAISEIDVLSAEADMKAAEAQIAIAQASLDDAERDLKYTKILSPADGRISKDLVDIGNLVGAADPTLLTTVVRDDPLFVDFEISERAILPYLSQRPNQESPNLAENTKALPIRLTLSNGEAYPHTGSINFIDNAVNPDSGTMRARAEFENADGALAAGLFVRIGIPQEIEDAVMIPSIAIQRDIGGSFVLVAGGDNKAERRTVKPAPFILGELRVIEEGIRADDRVIVSNFQRVRDGIAVAPEEIIPLSLPAEAGGEKPTAPPATDDLPGKAGEGSQQGDVRPAATGVRQPE